MYEYFVVSLHPKFSVVLAEEASKIASTYSDVFTATILDVEKCRELKMGSYLGVSVASANSPHFIHLCYKPVGGNVKRKLAIVGKGLTFDRFVQLCIFCELLQYCVDISSSICLVMLVECSDINN